MNNQASSVLTEVAKNTDSSVVLLCIIISIVLIVIAIPMYKMMLSNDKDKRKINAQREGQIIDVIQQNTAVISELKVLFQTNNHSAEENKKEYHERLDDIELAVKEHNDKLVEVHTLLRTRTCLMLKEGNGNGSSQKTS